MKINDKTPIKTTGTIKHKITQDFRAVTTFDKMSVQDKKNVKSLVVHIEASHAGIINGNGFFYMPKGMENGVSTWTAPFPKPVLVNHDNKSDPIGRVYGAKYVDYGLADATSFGGSNYPGDVIEHIMDFTKGPTFGGGAYKGLGHLELESEITDTDSIQKILDGRYLTVSIGGSCKDVTCSSCGSSIKDEIAALKNGKEPKDGDCFHEIGVKYKDSEPATFYVGGDMEFDEISYVSSPADPNAISRVANAKQSNSLTVCDAIAGKPQENGAKLHISLTIKDTQQESTEMKTKLADFLSKPEDTLALVKQTLKDMGLEKAIATDEKYAGLRKASYLFADEKVIPIFDKAHVLAAYKILENLEDEADGKTLSGATSTLDSKANRIFGDKFVKDDAIKALQDEFKDAETEEQKAARLAAATAAAKPTDAKVDPITGAPIQDNNVDTIVIDYAKLAEEVGKQLTVLVEKDRKTSYDFLLKRNEILEKDLEDSANRENLMTDQIKCSIIDHIITIDDSEKIEVLQARTLDSLSDKLKDLKAKKKNTQSGVATVAVVDTKVITDTNVTPAEGGTVVNPDTTPVVDTKVKPEYMEPKTVASEYKKILKASGFIAAKTYLEDLKKNNKVHPDFKLM